MTYEDALALFRSGHLRELIDRLSSAGASINSDPKRRVLLAYALALTDTTDHRLSVLPNLKTLSPYLKSQSMATLGLASWRHGDREGAIRHLHASIAYARDANDPERVAWAYLHLFRIVIEHEPPTRVEVILRDARKAVTNAGMPYLSAYLHVCVSVVEWQRGHLAEASRHCDIAVALLERQPNTWIEGATVLSRAAISYLSCEFADAVALSRKALQIATLTGSKHNAAAARIIAGHSLLLSGDFESAERTLREVLDGPYSDELRTIGASDSLARIYLANGDLDRCEAILAPLFPSSRAVEASQHLQAARWASLTNAKLLLRKNHVSAALTWLENIREQLGDCADPPFHAALQLMLATGYEKAGDSAACADALFQCERSHVTHVKELQGQFQHSISRVLMARSTELASAMRRRAQRIWAHQSSVSIPLELGDVETVAQTHGGAQTCGNALTAVNNIRSLFDLADLPKLATEEVLALVRNHCPTLNAVIYETSDAVAETRSSNARIEFRLTGQGGRKSLVLKCDKPRQPGDALALGDIVSLARSAFALEQFRLKNANNLLLWPTEVAEDNNGVICASDEMQALLNTARRAASSNVPILITGETGTGKEVLARLIHGYSPRAAKTFLPFNCSATPREMLDSQLFGHRRGAFTGASENFAGVIRAASGGTLFLDEIGESTLDIQPKLLRFLESGDVHPIGETHPQHVDVRVLAATNADIDELVAQGRFREDLFYRLNIIRLHIPPLRERRVEIPSFAHHYLQKHAREAAKGELRMSEETMEYLVLYRWPGNVRQLANEMRRIAALAEANAVIMPEHLSPEIAASRRTLPASERTLDPSELVVRIDQPLSAAVQHLEQTMVGRALAKAKSVDEAARMLGLSRKGLYLKRLRFGMDIDRPRGDVEVA